MTAPHSRLRILLLFSLVLNIALGAAIGALLWKRGEGGRGPRFGGVVRMPQLQLLESALPATDHAALRAAYALHRPQVGTAFRAMREAKREVRAALLAEPFDGAALAAALAQMRGNEQGVASAAHALLVEVASGISPAGRQALAKIVTSRRLWRGEGRRSHREDSVKAPRSAP